MSTEVSLLSDMQVAAIIAAIASVGGALAGVAKWAVGRVVRAIDQSSADSKAQTIAFTRMEVKLDEIHDYIAPRPVKS